MRLLPRLLSGGVAALLLGLAAISASGAAPKEPVVSWFFMYPFFSDGIDVMPQSGAHTATVMAGGWGMAAQPWKIDFAPLDAEIAYAEKYGLKLTMISECNPLYTPAAPWLIDDVRKAGELVKDSSGADGAIPSFNSPVFRSAQDWLVKGVTERIKERDTSRVIAYYHPGAEWWFPMNQRYADRDVAAFRNWLRKRYGGIAKLNAVWESKYADFDAVPAPRLDWSGAAKGGTSLSRIVSPDNGGVQCSWSLGASAVDPKAAPESYVHVTPGKTYTVSFRTRVDAPLGAGVFTEIAWTGANGGGLLSLDAGKEAAQTSGWQTVSFTVTAPKDAGRAWVLLKFCGVGSALFDDFSFVEAGSSENLAPNPGMETGKDMPDYWSFQNWSGGGGPKPEYLTAGGPDGGRCVKITAPKTHGSYSNFDAAVNDWSEYWYQAGAEYINWCSSLYKKYDPSRPTVTYLTQSFGYPVEWDYSQFNAISPDAVGMSGRDVDIFGLQTCAADTDPYRITACVDLMRKYRKPVWVVDLIDFTSGVHIGFEKMNKITQSAVQHGATGLVYCGWNIPFAMDYSFYPNWTTADQKKMVEGARKSIELLNGLSVAPECAIIEPILPASPNDREGFKNDNKSFMGWYKIVETMGRTADVVTLRELEYGAAKLSKYKWVMLPDCAYIPRKALAALEAYVKAGGKLVTSGRTPRFDDNGLKIAANLPAPLPDYGRTYTGPLLRDTHAGNTPPLFLWRADTAVTRKALADARSALTKSLNASHTPASVQLVGKADGVRVMEYAAKGRRAVYLVNMGSGTVSGLKLRVRAKVTSAEAHADLVPGKRPIRSAAGYTEISLPSFGTSCLVRMTVR